MKKRSIELEFMGEWFKVEFTGCYFEEETRDCPANYTEADVIKLEWVKDTEIVDVTELLQAGFINAEYLDEAIFEKIDEIRNEYNG